MEVRRGDATEWTWPNPTGTHVVPIAQSERVEVQLPPIDGATYSGYQVTNGARGALPLGSTLDPVKGIFYWQPAAGFLGRYDVVFTASTGATTPVALVVGLPMRTVIDTPTSGTSVEQPFTVAGWAIDLAAADMSGIDTVHVWAYPTTGGAPIFLGVAAYGAARPDVGAVYGEPFERSAFSLAVSHLLPQQYDVVVYPHRASTGAFQGAQLIRITVR